MARRALAGSVVKELDSDAVQTFYQQFLQSQAWDNAGHLQVGPLPTILEFCERTGQRRPDGLDAVGGEAKGLVSYHGEEGALLVPSLNAASLLGAINTVGAVSVTLLVGVNSDSFDRGLGIIIEAPPTINETQEHLEETYVFNGLGVKLNRNVVKFHPDMDGGQLRIEGPGGFPNKDIGFTPPGWTNSNFSLNMLEIVTTDNGRNQLTISSPSRGLSWTTLWKHKLFDGRHFPAVYAFMDLGGEAGKPLMVGQITFKL